MCDKILVNNNQVINFKYVRKLEIFVTQKDREITAELLVTYENSIGKVTETIVTLYVSKPIDLKKLQKDMDKFLTYKIINADKLIELDRNSIHDELVRLTDVRNCVMYVKPGNNETSVDGYVLLKDNKNSNLYLIWTGEVWDVKKARNELKDFFNIEYTCSAHKTRARELIRENRYLLNRSDFYTMRGQVLTEKDRSKLIEDDIYKQLGEL